MKQISSLGLVLATIQTQSQVGIDILTIGLLENVNHLELDRFHWLHLKSTDPQCKWGLRKAGMNPSNTLEVRHLSLCK